jgi:amino acid adenylation domain-containing protein
MGTASVLSSSDLRQVRYLETGPHELFEAQVEATPEASALAMGGVRISYCELNSQSNKLAHFLRQQGIGFGNVVGVHLDRSFESIVSFLALLKCGATYLPLDPMFPKDRLEFMVEDAKASLLLTSSSREHSAPQSDAPVVLLDREAKSIRGFTDTNPNVRGEALDPAYLIYTSGSTGRPKGVMVPRSALSNFLLSMLERPGIGASDTLLAVTPASFDISILEMLLPLVCGARIAIATAQQAADAGAIGHLLAEHNITVMQATPATWRLLLDSGWEGKSDLRILCGGEALTALLARQLLPRCQELWNMYGPTETTIWSSTDRIFSADRISLGKPIANTQLHILDENRQPVPPGVPGELWIGGAGLALGYFERLELTAEKFVADFTGGFDAPNARLYRTGDEVRLRDDGSIEFVGRLDHQVKLNGFRIELGEIESALTDIDEIGQAVVVLREDRPGEKRLVAYYTAPASLVVTEIAQTLKRKLPDYMVPALFVHLGKFPLTPNGKLDRKALPAPGGMRPNLAQDYIAPRSAVEKQLAALWRDILHLDEVGIDDSFIDLGGNSLEAVHMTSRYQALYGQEIPAVKVFQYPTIAKLAGYLEHGKSDSDLLHLAQSRTRRSAQAAGGRDTRIEGVAIIGMSGRFPGAANIDQLWSNLRNGVESISFFSPEELGPGIDEQLRNDPDYIRARGLIEGADLFDASFFGISPLEAKVTDPQQRVFLELAHQALEDAGYDPERSKKSIGIFAGIGDNHYYTTNLLTQPDLLAMAGKLAVEYGNQKDYVALRAAYLLDLRGPAISLNTACSTTLLAVDQAYRSLLDNECDIALSGGIDITVPQKSGFLYQPGGTFAKDGHCRPFDAEATGTMFCDGAGVVVLKRLSDALDDGDTIYAVIRGTGKNNNGARPASFLAPSVEGQAEAIAIAQANADVPIESIGYIEAHGTGTPVGDPIEFEALRRVFESKTDKKQFCTIGSIKGNIGHSTNAAGVVGLIKASLVLYHEEIPPTLHFKSPNPKIDFENSPFKMADRLIPFPRNGQTRRAAVSSFGFGGTNVHVILEEGPAPKPAYESRPRQLVLLSAKSGAAIESYSRSMGESFSAMKPESFADAAFTLQTGRKQMAHRRFAVAASSQEAGTLLAKPNPLRCGSKHCERRNPAVVFLFGGQGTQYVNMGLNLYQGEPLFRAVVDDACEILKPHLGRDLREILYPRSGDEETARISLQNTLFTQPSIFILEYALARYWQNLGVEPALMAGHSVGEFVAATLAGVWTLEDVLGVVALRARLMQSLPRGSMMSVSLSAEGVSAWLPDTLQIASVNAPELCVVSGPDTEIRALRERLEEKNIVCRLLHTSHAFHSAMMEPIVEPLRAAIEKIELHAPLKPIVSTVTGFPMTAEQATDPSYWANHARATVQFGKAISYFKEQGYDLFLECGPRSTLCSLAHKQFPPAKPCTAIPTLGDRAENEAEWESLLFALGSLWQNGVPIDWEAFYAHEQRRRIALPTYPFERKRFWVDPAPVAQRGPVEGAVSIPASIAASAVEGSLFPKASACQPSLQSVPHAAVQLSRKDRLASCVIDLLLPISGRKREEIDSAATFMELGFDSLSLTQAAFAISKEYSVKIGFGQLMKEFPNVEMLAEHLDSILPAEILAEAAVAEAHPSGDQADAQPAVAPPAAGARLEEVVAEQARTISRLVAMLEGAGAMQPASFPKNAAGDAVQLAVRQEAQEPDRGIPTSGGATEAETTIPQRGIFASSCLSDNLSAAYNESVILRLSGTISPEKIEQAIERLVERHDALRASFDKAGQRMKIAPAVKIVVKTAELSGPEPSASEPSATPSALEQEQLSKVLAEESATPFPLPEGPLFRARIVLLGQDRAALILTAHHVICDGWSLDVLIHDFCAFYSEELSGERASLTPAESYFDYVRGEAELERSAGFSEAAAYWRRKFAEGFPMLALPTDKPRQPRRLFKARCAGQLVAEPATQQLRDFAARQGCSFFAMLLSSLAIQLARVSRQRRFVIALPAADQPVKGKPGLVGHCVNLLPFAVDLRTGEAFGDFLKRVQSDLLAAQDNAAYTMVSLLGELCPEANAVAFSPIPAGFTSARQFRSNELCQAGFSLEYDLNPKAYESFEFYLNAMESDRSLELRCHYDVQLFEEITIREWLTGLGSILEEVAAAPWLDVLTLAHLDGAGASQAAEVRLCRLPGRDLPSATDGSAASDAFPGVDGANDAGLEGEHRAPAVDGVEQVVAGWWRELLGVEQIALDDDFFALGGHSLTAVRLFSKIAKAYRLDIELAILFQARTVRKLSAAIRGRIEAAGAAGKKSSSLVPIQPQGSNAPFFCVHARGGDVIFYEQLASALGPDRPFYAFQSPLVAQQNVREVSLEELASIYVRDLRAFYPQGPYLIGGASFGGLIAFEMARQLHALGAEPSLLVLFDTAVPGHEQCFNTGKRIARFWEGLRREGAGYLGKKAAVKGKCLGASFYRSLQLLACRLYRIRGRSLPLRLHYFEVEEAHQRAQDRYVLKPYAGKITLIRALRRGSEPVSRKEDYALGWGALAGGGLEMLDVDTSHMYMLFEPYVREFVKSLKPLLQSCS